METSLFNRLQASLLALATVGLVFLAVMNFRQEIRFRQPWDGVWWSEAQGGLVAPGCCRGTLASMPASSRTTC